MKRIVSFIAVLFLLIMSGCSDYHEINDTAMVSGIAIDREGEKSYRVSAEIIQPAGSDQASTGAKVISEEGNSMEDCLNRMVNSATKDLHFTHCKLVLFSQKIAEDGISDFVDTFLRDPRFRADLYLAVVAEGKASDMLRVGEQDDRICSFDFASVIENSYTETGSVPPTQLYQFFMDGDLSMLPSFAESEGCYSVCGVVGFRKGIACGNLDLRLTQSMLLVSGEYRRGELILTPENGNSVPCQIRSVAVKKKISEADGITVSVQIQCKIRLTSLPKEIDIATEKNLQKTEAELSRLLTEKLKSDWNRARGNGMEDFFGLSVYVYRHDPNLLEKRKSEGQISFEPTCSVILENFGFTDERISE